MSPSPVRWAKFPSSAALAVLVSAALGLWLLLPGGPLHAQSSETIEYAEHTPITSPVATFTATDDEDDKAGKALEWSVEGADAELFDISESGVLTFRESPDYEAPKDADTDNTYTIGVVATDSAGGPGTYPIEVKVTNDDEPGTLTLSNRQPVVGVEFRATLTDADGLTSDVQWQWASGSSPGGPFTRITATDTNGAGTAAYVPDATDRGRYLRATVTYADPHGAGKQESVVSDQRVLVRRAANAPPVIIGSDGNPITDASTTREVPENSRAGTSVGDPIGVSNPEGDVLTYTLSGDDSEKFTLDQNGQIRVGAGTVLNAEVQKTGIFSVTVTVEDGNLTGLQNAANYSDSIDVTIVVTDVPEAPELSGPASVSHPENTAVGTAVAAYTVKDDEDDKVATPVEVELLGADASAFTLIDGNSDGTWELAFKATPDFESPLDAGRNNTYNVTVKATDSSGRTAVQNVAVMVANVDEPGEVTLSTLTPKVGVLLTAKLTGDLDGTPSRVTWKWERSSSGDGSSPTVIAGATSVSYTPVHDDEDKYLVATALYTDPQGAGKSALAVSTNAVDGSNKPPMFAESTITLTHSEGRSDPDTFVGSAVSATDPNSDDTLTYELSGDATLFSIDRGTGQIKVKAGTTLDYETKSSYVMTVKATDPSGASATATVTINITDVQESPVIRRGGLAVVGPAIARYAENGSGPVATYKPQGPTAARAGWSLSGADAAKFSISTGGVLSFKAPPDYETPGSADGDNIYLVVVTANDGENDPVARPVTVTVTDVDETSTGDPVLDRGDTNQNGKIDRPEVVQAIDDYFAGGQASDLGAVVQLMERYFQDAQS